MKPVISVELMRKSDEYTIKNYTDSKTLMYSAGKGVFKSFPWRGKTAIVCGSGNNAGDGYVLALLLKEHGIDSKLFLIKEKFSQDGLYYFEKCRDAGIEYCICNENTDFNGYNEIADCIFGTGFKGTVKGLCADIIDKINESGKTVVSVDINSGLNGDSGEYEKCVKSDVTVSVGYVKTGFYLGGSNKKINKIINCDIGIKLVGSGYTLIESGDKFDADKIKNAVYAEYPGGDDPVGSLIEAAKRKNTAVISRNVLTDGKNTYIFENRDFLPRGEQLWT